MATVRLVLNAPSIADVNAGRSFEPTQTLKARAANAMIDLVAGIVSGAYPKNPRTIAVSVDGLATAASATVTFASAVGADTVTVNGVVFTAVSGAAGANQFDISGGNTTGAASLASSINNSATALVPATVIATAAVGVLTIKAVVPGITGNAYTLATSNNTRLVNSVNAGGRLTAGVNDPGAKTFTF